MKDPATETQGSQINKCLLKKKKKKKKKKVLENQTDKFKGPRN